MRQLLQTMINALLSADADQMVGAEWGRPSPARITHRNGYRHRDLDTRVGTIDVAIPKLRPGRYFPTMKVREGGGVTNTVVLGGTGVNPDGRSEVLGLSVVTSETEPAWNAFFADLAVRGLTGVQLVTSDAHAGLKEAIAANRPGAAWQCRTHYAANLMSVTPKSMRLAVKAMLHSVYDQPDAAAVACQFDRTLDYVAEKLPQVAEHLESAREEICAFTTFPKIVRQQIWSKNPNERLNREIRRRTDSVGIFPNREAIIRRVGAVLTEQTDEWAEGRRYLGLDVLARSRIRAVPDTGSEVNTDPILALSA